MVVSGLTSILFGLAPALHTSASDLANPLREAGRSLQGGLRQALLRKGLVVAEVALSLMLLVAAGLMIRTFLAVQGVELGFRADRLLTVRVPLPEPRYPDRARRVLLCSGKIYYELAPERDKRSPQETAIVRVEQLYPFPEAEVRAVMSSYPNAAHVIWVQEEPRNMGAWSFVRGHLQPMLS